GSTKGNFSDFSTVNNNNGEYAGKFDVYVIGLNGITGASNFSRIFGGAHDDFGMAIATDYWGQPFVTGFTWNYPWNLPAGMPLWAGGVTPPFNNEITFLMSQLCTPMPKGSFCNTPLSGAAF